MRNTVSGPTIRAADTGKTDLAGEEIVAAYGFDQRKMLTYLSMLGMLIAVGIIGVAQAGLSEGWGLGFLLVLLPAGLLAMLLRDIRLGSPLIVATREGLIDRRRSPEPIVWADIIQAESKRRLYGKALRLLLISGEPREMDLSLINADPGDIINLIRSMVPKEDEPEDEFEQQ